MQIWCVPSHVAISPRPWEGKGILLKPEDLENKNPELRIWRPPCGNIVAKEDSCRIERDYTRSPNQDEYLTVLRVLATMDPPELLAVVSLRWLSDKPFGLVTAKYVWLTIYAEGGARQLLTLSHRPGNRPYVTFLEALPGDTPGDEEDWRMFFADALLERAA